MHQTLKRHAEELFVLAHAFVTVREGINKSAGTFRSLFQKIDFKELLVRANTIETGIAEKAQEIAALKATVEAENDGHAQRFYSQLVAYVEALSNAARVLSEKMVLLSERAGNRRRLSVRDFIETTKSERVSLEACQSTGDILTEMFYSLNHDAMVDTSPELEGFEVSARPKIQQLGEALLASPRPGAVTDRRLVAIMERKTPNVLNAWTHVVPAMAKFAKAAGERSLFERDKGADAYDEFLKKLSLVVVGLYADGVISPGSASEDCLYELVSSLAAFKEAHPNWQDAYSIGYKQFVEGYDASLGLVASLQRSVETYGV